MNYHFGTRSANRENYRQIVTDLWAEGLSQSQIGKRIGKTKNAVAGMVRHFGLPRRVDGILRGWDAKRANEAKAEAEKKLAQTRLGYPVQIDTTPLSIPLLSAANGQCRYPMWHSSDRDESLPVCGLPQKEGSPYCVGHDQRCRITPKKPDSSQ